MFCDVRKHIISSLGPRVRSYILKVDESASEKRGGCCRCLANKRRHNRNSFHIAFLTFTMTVYFC